MDDVFYFSLAFGWAVPKIAEQLDEFGIEGVPADRLDHWQKSADAILRLRMDDVLTDSQAKTARNRMTRNVEKWLRDNEHVQVAA